jgi:hypothetical protein
MGVHTILEQEGGCVSERERIRLTSMVACAG